MRDSYNRESGNNSSQKPRRRYLRCLHQCLFVLMMLGSLLFSVSVYAAPGKVELKSITATKSKTVQISWAKTEGATDYFVYYKVPDGKWKRVAKVSSKVTSYTHSSSSKFPLKANKKYFFTVRAYDKVSNTYGKYDKKGLKVKIPKGTISSRVASINMAGNTGLRNGNTWGNIAGKSKRTVCKVLGIDGREYAAWLEKNMKNDYYIGTPYSGVVAAPKGDYKGVSAGPQMNCTSFVWHVLWKAMEASGSKQTPSSFGFGARRTNTISGWWSAFTRNNMERYYYKTKEDLMVLGKPKKGDLIYFWARGEGVTGVLGADNHVLIYMGDGKTDLAWHSAGSRVWCDGTYDNHPGGHWISNPLRNSITEIASPQNVQYCYCLIRAGAKF